MGIISYAGCSKMFWNKRLSLIWFHLYDKLLWLLPRFYFLWNLKIISIWYKFLWPKSLCVAKAGQFNNKSIIPQIVMIMSLQISLPSGLALGEKKGLSLHQSISSQQVQTFFFHLQFLVTQIKFCRNVWSWEVLMKTEAIGASVWFWHEDLICLLWSLWCRLRRNLK